VEILESEDTDAFAVYYADARSVNEDREPTFNSELGLAVEKLREGLSVSSLWHVVHN
jgi:Bardet-Biedl syndrome 5 protein